ncbi:RNA polymerase sigma factor [Fibrella forsythiae]|uniref:RNA polymerase sigma factor n=1 Tax=Fibrella forsythiae TaxID=2817061 RepID=A0ABS3JSM1_9BACT|nr:RNA polymerase sigma factor [Fibrella forsythiae]MBO0951887.1 RNA polymerase sigma factor [Fibrella forsythiae]
MTIQLSDQELINRFVITEDHQYFTQLYTRHRQRVYQTCLQYTGNPDDSDDFVQEIFLRLMKKLGSYRGDALFTTWLRTITTNYYLDQLRKRKREQALWCSYELELTVGPKWATIADDSYTHTHTYERTLKQLPVMQRELLYSKYEAGISINAIAVRQGLTPSAVKMRIKRAREMAKHLHKKLQEEEDYL